LLNIYVHFQIARLKNKLASVEKELQQAKMDNTALARYINTKRKKEGQREEEARKKTEKGQSSKDLFPPAS
jgi:regulator of replication initiation timing